MTNRVKEYRDAAGLSQSELAAMVGVAKAYIGHIETGRVINPGVRFSLKLADALGVGAGDLFPSEEEEAAVQADDWRSGLTHMGAA